MKVSLHCAAPLVLAALAAISANASAQSARQWTVKAGIGEINPNVHSGEVTAPALPHTKADVGSDARPVFSIGYGLTDNISAQLDLGVPFRHEIYGAGSIAGTGTLGTVQALPPTLLLQYRGNTPTSLFRPYVGAGITYAYHRHETGTGKLTAITNTGSSSPTTFDIDNKLCPTLQAGLAVNITERWFADFSLSRTRLRTVVHYSTGQTQQMRLDPTFTSASIGYKF